jgi:hypothetical protein
MAIAATVGQPALAASDAEVAELRAQIEEMRGDYERRIADLEERVARAETDRGAAALAAPPPAAATGANAFNPSISLILQGRAAAFSGDPGPRDLPGFLLGEETGLGAEGFSLGETELVLSANVDDLFYGFFNVAIADDGEETEVEVEEAFFQPLSLPEGFGMKAGQFLSAIGYHNAKHSHSWDFTDAPLNYEAMLGTHYLDPGVQLSWLAPTDRYLQFGVEAFRGDDFPASGGANGGVGTWSLYAKTGGEMGDSHSWQAGLALLTTEARDRESEDELENLFSFSGDSDLVIADFVWKWAPRGDPTERNFTFQSEYMYRDKDGDLDLANADGDFSGPYEASQHGFYAQAVYQFMPRWRVGLRYDALWGSNDVDGLPATSLDLDGRDPQRASAMLDYSHSEFSRLRLQLNQEWGGRDSETAVFLQYIMSLGSHGAHEF